MNDAAGMRAKAVVRARRFATSREALFVMAGLAMMMRRTRCCCWRCSDGCGSGHGGPTAKRAKNPRLTMAVSSHLPDLFGLSGHIAPCVSALTEGAQRELSAKKQTRSD